MVEKISRGKYAIQQLNFIPILKVSNVTQTSCYTIVSVLNKTCMECHRLYVAVEKTLYKTNIFFGFFYNIGQFLT